MVGRALTLLVGSALVCACTRDGPPVANADAAMARDASAMDAAFPRDASDLTPRDAGSALDAASPAVDAGVGDAGILDVGCPTVSRPAGVPDGWEELRSGDCDCLFYVPASAAALPAPTQWDLCRFPSAPAQCQQVKEEGWSVVGGYLHSSEDHPCCWRAPAFLSPLGEGHDQPRHVGRRINSWAAEDRRHRAFIRRRCMRTVPCACGGGLLCPHD